MSKAPFTSEQIESLNGFQHSGCWHPFTCGNSDCRGLLRAIEQGWICDFCGYTQDWAHDFMANGDWKKHPLAQIIGEIKDGNDGTKQ